MHVETKQLAPAIRRALESVSYGARDIEVVAADSVSGHSEGGQGQRGFVLILNLDTGRFQTVNGSWGGANPWDRRAVDLTDERIALPENGCVIKGQVGYPRTFATVYAAPNSVGRFLPSGEEEVLSDAEQQAIYCFAAIKGGEYRREELQRRGVSGETVDSLVERGYLKRNKAGATMITVKGKNARTVRY